jgi:hypothetical protein
MVHLNIDAFTKIRALVQSYWSPDYTRTETRRFCEPTYVSRLILDPQVGLQSSGLLAVTQQKCPDVTRRMPLASDKNPRAKSSPTSLCRCVLCK